ncbi:hypothetical protein FRB98_004036 [Tulasnella sp. 332]|nr:hypothetical protein FRB98_004036 [Tulasnella sp. 332]
MHFFLAPATALSLLGASLVKASVTVYLCGDSTMALGGAGDGDTDGWGQYLAQYITRPVVNDGSSGILVSASTALNILLSSHRRPQLPLLYSPGAGSQTCSTVYDGVAETVLTYPAYQINAANLMIAKGAHVILSSPTPDNPWETGVFVEGAESRFTTYSRTSAASLGQLFINHELYTYQFFQTAGLATVTSYYPNDHTHTSPAGANVVAQAFVRGLVCTGSTLAGYVNHLGLAITGTCN